ncbi:MAG: ice-binding family protein [Allgaiera sp.]|nr:ice-binding family protein [Allgaiera sp.]
MPRLKSQKVALSFLAALACTPLAALASTIMGADLSSFTVLGASTVTNAPTSTIRGNVGVWPGTSLTGFTSVSNSAVSDPQVTDGLVHSATALAETAQGQLTASRNDLASLGGGTVLAADLAGLTLSPGVYTVPAGTTNLSGTLTLDGGGNANAAWVFQMPSTLITSPDAVVNMIGTGTGAGLFWNVGSSATLDTNTMFLGNILAYSSITANTRASNSCGRLLAGTGAVTLDQNGLSGVCGGLLSGTHGLNGGFDVTVDGSTRKVAFLKSAPIAAVPLPGSFGLLGLGLVFLFAVRRKRATA